MASDPISEAGIVAALKKRAEVWIAADDHIAAQTVAVVVAEGMDEEAASLLRSARAKGSRRAVVVVSEVDDEGLLRAVDCEVGGLVRRREATADRLVQVISSVARGAGVVPPDLLGRLLRLSHLRGRAQDPGEARMHRLTRREEEVLKLVAVGLDTREIAERLAYSERTVKNDLAAVTDRFHLRNRSHAVAYAIREGFI
ncbi:helix-turn-helix transcriptional regulator [Streptomyces goshikiensis]|uniref:helix-turn-helix transcriptional regulator n=1 Tax=Streptomyces goshikiensis TaxID=1942 RepID=UPI00368DE6DB